MPTSFAPQTAQHLKHPTKTAFTVATCLTSEECRNLIDFSEQTGYEPALLNVGAANILATDTRKSHRCMIDNCDLANALYERVKHLVPTTLFERGNGGREMEAVGLNERLRFLRYTSGDYFVQHMDGTYVRPMGHPKYGEKSMLTFLVYLNESFEGGALEMQWGPITSIQPSTGLVVVHDHQILHEAMVVQSGTRYCIRTDIMYRPKTLPKTDEGVKEDAMVEERSQIATLMKALSDIKPPSIDIDPVALVAAEIEANVVVAEIVKEWDDLHGTSRKVE